MSEIIKKRDPTIDPYADDYQSAQQNLLFIFIYNLIVIIFIGIYSLSAMMSVNPLVGIFLCSCYLLYFVVHGIYQIIGRFRPCHSQVGMTAEMKRFTPGIEDVEEIILI